MLVYGFKSKNETRILHTSCHNFHVTRREEREGEREKRKLKTSEEVPVRKIEKGSDREKSEGK